MILKQYKKKILEAIYIKNINVSHMIIINEFNNSFDSYNSFDSLDDFDDFDSFNSYHSGDSFDSLIMSKVHF